MTKWILIGIVVLAALLRLVGLSSHPSGFTPDEASFGYDAYSLLTTGKDQWGESFPLVLRSFGDFKPPLYAYLTIPTVAMFGLNEMATRLPNALIGVLAVITTFFMVRELMQRSGKDILEKYSVQIGLLSALSLAISPWHVAMSRGAFEANLTVFFMTLGVWGFLKGLDKPKWMFVSALGFGLNMFSYHSARLVTPLIIISLVILFLDEVKKLERSKLYLPFIIVSIFAIVSFATFLTGAGARSGDIAIFNPTDNWESMVNRRYEAFAQGVPAQVARIYSNKVVYTFDIFVDNYLSYFSLNFLFVNGPGEWTYGMIPGRGVMYIGEIMFIMSALFFVIRDKLYKSKSVLLLLFWIFVSAIPAALAKGPGYAGNRSAVMMPMYQTLSALGAILLYLELMKIKPFKKLSKVLVITFVGAMSVSLLFFLEDYIYHQPIHGSEAMLYGRGEAVNLASDFEDSFEEVVYSRSLSEPHIYVAFYKKWDPTDYQKQSQDWLRYEDEGRSFVDQLGEYRLGKYVFTDMSYETKVDYPILLIGKPDEFPESTIPDAIVPLPNELPAIYLIGKNSDVYAKAY